jgi:hypothetical protein
MVLEDGVDLCVDMFYQINRGIMESAKTYTKEESLQIFVSAGILDKEGDFTDPYPESGEVC